MTNQVRGGAMSNQTIRAPNNWYQSRFDPYEEPISSYHGSLQEISSESPSLPPITTMEGRFQALEDMALTIENKLDQLWDEVVRSRGGGEPPRVVPAMAPPPPPAPDPNGTFYASPFSYHASPPVDLFQQHSTPLPPPQQYQTPPYSPQPLQYQPYPMQLQTYDANSSPSTWNQQLLSYSPLQQQWSTIFPQYQQEYVYQPSMQMWNYQSTSQIIPPLQISPQQQRQNQAALLSPCSERGVFDKMSLRKEIHGRPKSEVLMFEEMPVRGGTRVKCDDNNRQFGENEVIPGRVWPRVDFEFEKMSVVSPHHNSRKALGNAADMLTISNDGEHVRLESSKRPNKDGGSGVKTLTHEVIHKHEEDEAEECDDEVYRASNGFISDMKPKFGLPVQTMNKEFQDDPDEKQDVQDDSCTPHEVQQNSLSFPGLTFLPEAILCVGLHDCVFDSNKPMPGHSVIVYETLCVTSTNRNGATSFEVSGTLVDCVSLAMSGVLFSWSRTAPVVRRINRGSITENDIVTTAVFPGNGNIEGRGYSLTRANYRTSLPLAQLIPYQNCWGKTAEEGLISSSQVIKKFSQFAESLHDLTIDIPSTKAKFQLRVPSAIFYVGLDSFFLESFGAYGASGDDDKLAWFKKEAVILGYSYHHKEILGKPVMVWDPGGSDGEGTRGPILEGGNDFQDFLCLQSFKTFRSTISRPL